MPKPNDDTLKQELAQFDDLSGGFGYVFRDYSAKRLRNGLAEIVESGKMAERLGIRMTALDELRSAARQHF